MLVPRDAAQELLRQVLGEALGEDDDAEPLALPLAGTHDPDDVPDDLVQVHGASRARLARRRVGHLLVLAEVALDVLDADHEAGLARDGGAVGEPAGGAAHGLGEEVALGRLGVGEEIPDLAGEGLDGGEVAEGEVDAEVVVVDRLGDVHHGDPPGALGQVSLEHLELVGGLERVVAADGDERVDLQRRERRVHGAERAGLLLVAEVGGAVHEPAGVGPGGAEQDAAAVPGAAEALVGEADVVLPLAERPVGAVLHQVGIAVEDADDLDPLLEERGGGGGDDGVGRGRGPAREEDGHPADRPPRAFRRSGHGALPMVSVIGAGLLERPLEAMVPVPESPSGRSKNILYARSGAVMSTVFDESTRHRPSHFGGPSRADVPETGPAASSPDDSPASAS